MVLVINTKKVINMSNIQLTSHELSFDFGNNEKDT